MWARTYLKWKPKQKRPKDHDAICDGYDTCDPSNIYYPRKKSAKVKETPTSEKIRNLFLFALESDGDPDSVNPRAFCSWREISLSNFRRLLAIMREYYGVYSEDGNTYYDTPTNRKYLALLALHEKLEDGVDMKAFCDEFHIGRTTFFRYLAAVEDFYSYWYNGKKAVSLLGDGRYIGIYPDDLRWEYE